MTAPKFDTVSNSFVRTQFGKGPIMMVLAVHAKPRGHRYDLQAIDGTTFGNIGEYELVECTTDEVKAALIKAGKEI